MAFFIAFCVATMVATQHVTTCGLAQRSTHKCKCGHAKTRIDGLPCNNPNNRNNNNHSTTDTNTNIINPLLNYQRCCSCWCCCCCCCWLCCVLLSIVLWCDLFGCMVLFTCASISPRVCVLFAAVVVVVVVVVNGGG